MNDEAYFRAKGAQCRRLAGTFTNHDDPGYRALIKMAEDYERWADEQSRAESEPKKPQRD
jgi:hypothetical protein